MSARKQPRNSEPGWNLRRDGKFHPYIDSILSDTLRLVSILLKELNNFIAMIPLDQYLTILCRATYTTLRFQHFPEFFKILRSADETGHERHLLTCTHAFVQQYPEVLSLSW